MRKNVFIIIFVIVFVTMAFGEKDAFAAFVVSPMEFHLRLAEGDENTQTFYVRNRGAETIALKIYVNDFWIEPDGREVFLDSGEIERSCGPWIEITPEEIELAPDESQPIRFKLTVPPEKVGTYWVMLFVEQITKPSIKSAKRGEQQFNIISYQRVGVRVFEEIPGVENGEGKISAVNVGWDTENEALKVDLTFENDGELLLKCTGDVEIKDYKGEIAAKTELKEFSSYPKSHRIAGASFEEVLEPGQYTALAIVDYGEDFLVAGEAVFEIGGGPDGFSIAVAGGEEQKEEGAIEEEGADSEEGKETDIESGMEEVVEEDRDAEPAQHYIKDFIEKARGKILTLWEAVKAQWMRLYKVYVDKKK